MNIFKILANGHGTVNENNVSAFFAYLVDPNESHSLNREFMSRFVKLIIKDEDFNVNYYDSQIFLEQTFKSKDNGKDQRVDIVIVFYKIDMGEQSQSHVTSFIRNSKIIKKVILIENKIKTGSLTLDQVPKQREAAENHFKNNNFEMDGKIHSVYLTPDHDSFTKEFQSNTKPLTTHCKWHSENDLGISIVGVLKGILSDERVGDIEPIPDYTKQTIKAFIQFVKSDFKSENILNKEKKEGAYQKDIHSSLESYREKYPGTLDTVSFCIVEEFVKHLDIVGNKHVTCRHSKTHPVAVFYKGRKIMGINAWGSKVRYDFMYTNKIVKNILQHSIESKYDNKNITYHDNDSTKGVRVIPNTKQAYEIIEHFDTIIKAIEKNDMVSFNASIAST